VTGWMEPQKPAQGVSDSPPAERWDWLVVPLGARKRHTEPGSVSAAPGLRQGYARTPEHFKPPQKGGMVVFTSHVYCASNRRNGGWTRLLLVK